jgi:hypothetical protein
MAPGFLLAADLRLVPTEIPVTTGQVFGMVVKLDAAPSVVNAFELKIVFNDSKLTYQYATDATAVTSFWIRYPYLCEAGVLCLSGMIPGGFSGFDQELVIVYFTPKESGATTVLTEDIRILAHDGKGTEIPVTTTPLEIIVEESASLSEAQPVISDREPPEPFVPYIATDDAVENGAHMLIFDTKDKQSGVASYFVKEYSLPVLRWFTAWKKAESPYILTDQSRKSTIAVKAVDVYGNERIAYVSVEEGYIYQNILLSVFFAAILFIGSWSYKRRRRRTIVTQTGSA